MKYFIHVRNVLVLLKCNLVAKHKIHIFQLGNINLLHGARLIWKLLLKCRTVEVDITLAQSCLVQCLRAIMQISASAIWKRY